MAGLSELTGTVGFLRVAGQGHEPSANHIRWVQVQVQTNTKGQNGPPSQAESEELSAIEQNLPQGLDDPVLVAVISAGGIRDFWLYVRSDDGLDEWGQGLQVSYPGHRLDIHSDTDPTQGMYQYLRREGEVADSDRRTTERLAEEGLDLNQERRIEFFFYFSSEAQARDAARVLLGSGYEAKVGPSADDQWLLEASVVDQPLPHRIAHLRCMLDQFALDHGGSFDGWGTPIER